MPSRFLLCCSCPYLSPLCPFLLLPKFSSPTSLHLVFQTDLLRKSEPIYSCFPSPCPLLLFNFYHKHIFMIYFVILAPSSHHPQIHPHVYFYWWKRIFPSLFHKKEKAHTVTQSNVEHSNVNAHTPTCHTSPLSKCHHPDSSMIHHFLIINKSDFLTKE